MCPVREAFDERTFIKGVIEGFYGRPWTSAQRKELFRRLKAFNLNAYFYAPKDDCKHRSHWRERYDEQEIRTLKEIIDAARDAEIDFVFAISPGMDITYSSENDRLTLREKLKQVVELGCRHLAILFDDVDTELSETDIAAFQTLANAEAQLVNDLHRDLADPRLQFFVCPNEYCSAMASPSVLKSKYLRILGSQLRPEIHIMWTGPQVVADYISAAHLQKVRSVLGRKPIIWDNLHANDYDSRRLFVGPYTFRSPAIIDHVAGIFLNPNCEFEANFVPLYTMGAWWQMACKNGAHEAWTETISANELSDDGDDTADGKHEIIQRRCDDFVDVDGAIKSAVEDWCEIIEIACDIANHFDGQQACIADLNNSFLENDKCYVGDTINVAFLRDDSLKSRQSAIARHESHLSLLIDLFYLPFKLSGNLRDALQTFYNLCNVKLSCQDMKNRDGQCDAENGSTVQTNASEETASHGGDVADRWFSALSHFHVFTTKVQELLEWLEGVPNQRMKVEFMPHVSEVAGVLRFCEAYLDWIGALSQEGRRFSSGCKPKFKPWMGAGGTAMAFQKILFDGLSPDYAVAPVAMKFPHSISLCPMLADDKSDILATFRAFDRKLLEAGEHHCAFVLRDSGSLRGVMMVSPIPAGTITVRDERAQHQAVLEYQVDKLNASLHVQILFTAVFACLAHEEWRTQLYAKCQLDKTVRRAQLHALGFSTLRVDDDEVLLVLTA